MRLTFLEEERAARLVQRGLSYRQVARIMGATDKTIKAATLRYDDRSHQLVVLPLKSRIYSFDKDFLDRFRWHLTEREIVIFDNRLATSRPETLQAIADRLNISRQRTWQIEESIIARFAEFSRCA